MKLPLLVLLPFALTLHTAYTNASDAAPWGAATEIQQVYGGQKVVFDTTSGTLDILNSVLDRASLISKLNGADQWDTRIVIMLHGDAIPFFAIKNFGAYNALMRRAQSLSVGGVIEFRMCKAAAGLRGLHPSDIHGFVTMVPMADAEIVRLQQEEGFAYLR